MAMRPAIRRYTRRLTLVMILYIAVLVGVKLWFRHAPPTSALAYLAAVLPALPIAGVFLVIGRLLMEMKDEYVRMLLVRQSLIATGFALSVATGWGFLEGAGLVPHAEGYWAAVLWFAGLGVGGLANWALEARGPR
jgi:hypothetical protein